MPTRGTAHRNSNPRALCSQAVLLLSAQVTGNQGALCTVWRQTWYSLHSSRQLYKPETLFSVAFLARVFSPDNFFVLPINSGEGHLKFFHVSTLLSKWYLAYLWSLRSLPFCPRGNVSSEEGAIQHVHGCLSIDITCACLDRTYTHTRTLLWRHCHFMTSNLLLHKRRKNLLWKL